MKKLLLILLFLPFVLYGQNSRTIRNSWDGNGEKTDNSTGRKDSADAKIQMLSAAADSADTLPERTSYRSFFGKNKTSWTMLFEITCYTSNLVKGKKISPTCLNTCKVEMLSKDTFTYKGKQYMFDRCDETKTCCGIREDTTEGKIFILTYTSAHDTIEVKTCDMSLNVGDTFVLHNSVNFLFDKPDYCYCYAKLTADSVFYYDGRKIIRLRTKNAYGNINANMDWWFRYENISPVYFIEGIGTMYGLWGCVWWSSEREQAFLLCASKDDTLDFMSNAVWNCDINYETGGWFSTVEINETDSLSPLSAYPNPASDEITVKMESVENLGGKLLLLDAIGNVLLQKTLEETETVLNIRKYASGIYFLRYQSAKSVSVLKFVKQ